MNRKLIQTSKSNILWLNLITREINTEHYSKLNEYNHYEIVLFISLLKFFSEFTITYIQLYVVCIFTKFNNNKWQDLINKRKSTSSNLRSKADLCWKSIHKQIIDNKCLSECKETRKSGRITNPRSKPDPITPTIMCERKYLTNDTHEAFQRIRAAVMTDEHVDANDYH